LNKVYITLEEKRKIDQLRFKAGITNNPAEVRTYRETMNYIINRAKTRSR